jgi:hypothetical protein
MREVILCPNCGFLGSIENGAEIPKCNSCGSSMVRMNMSLDQWQLLSDQQKKDMMATQIVNGPKNDLYYLARIADSVKAIRNWVTLWSVLSLAIIGLWVLISII